MRVTCRCWTVLLALLLAGAVFWRDCLTERSALTPRWILPTRLSGSARTNEFAEFITKIPDSERHSRAILRRAQAPI